MFENRSQFEGPYCTIRILSKEGYQTWFDSADDHEKNWLRTTGFEEASNSFSLLPSANGSASSAIFVTSENPSVYEAAALTSKLPKGAFAIDDPEKIFDINDLIHGWKLSSYRFDIFKEIERQQPVLLLEQTDLDGAGEVLHLVDAAFLGRDLVNLPAESLGPVALEEKLAWIAGKFEAGLKTIKGEELLEQNYPLIHAVGRASSQAPRLVDLTWGSENDPKVTLVGKGVCFDTGGLDLKPANAMALMKKDMGGAAAMMALAYAIMANNLKVRLRLLVPAVENSVSASSFRPGDVFRSRKGLTVEIGNTDAEGRLVLADALDEACQEKPELLIDAATLTGAARVALGTEIAVMFSNDDQTAQTLIEQGDKLGDPIWRLPLHQPYRSIIKSPIADINNAGSKPFGGSITAALFLESFIEEAQRWIHLDVYGFNDADRPGRPRGGEAIALRPLYQMIKSEFGTRA